VRKPDALGELAGEVEVVRGDALDAAAVRGAVQGVEAVISSLGQGSSNKPTTTMSAGTANVVAGMRDAGVRRLLCVSSLGAADDPDEPFLFRTFGRWLYGNIFADHRRMEASVRASDLDWTILRPAALTDAPAKKRYRVSIDVRPRGASAISRADVAAFAMDELAEPRYVRRAVALGD